MEVNNIPDCYLNVQEPDEDLDNDENNGLKKRVVFEWVPDNNGFAEGEVKRYVVQHKDKYAITATIIAGTNTSSKKQILDITSKLKNGPYVTHGKDGKIIAHNTKANAKPSAHYRYNGGNGELLSFNIDGDYITTMVEVAKTTQIDPKDKSLQSKSMQVKTEEIKKLPMLTTYHPDLLKPKNVLSVVDNTYHKPNTQRNITTVPDINQKKSVAYKSNLDAYRDIQNNYEATEQDIQNYLTQLQDNFIKRQNPANIQDANEYRDLIKNGSVLENYTAKKKVTIHKTVDPAEYGPGGSETTREGGQSSTTVFTGRLRYYNRKLEQKWKQKKWTDGYNHLKANPNIIILTKGTPKVGSKIEIIEEKEMEVPITGARVLSSPSMLNFGNSQANEAIKSIYNQVKANATVLGRPSLTCSLNIEVDGIGSKYSGVWYIKKVKHSLDNQGYTCDIDFRKKDISISKQVIKTTVNTKQIYVNLNKTAKESLESGSWQYPGLLQIAVEKWRNDPSTPKKNYLIIQDPNDLKTGKIYSAESDFKTNSLDNINPTPIQEIKLSPEDISNGGIDDE